MPENPAPGWYSDGVGGQRWWNGENWTEHRAEAPALASASSVARIEVPAKSLGVAYLFLVLFGWFGAHRFYLNRRRTAIFMAAASGLMAFNLVWQLISFGHVAHSSSVDWVFLYARGILYLLSLAGLLTVVVWNFVDLFLIPSIARKLNAQIAAMRVAQTLVAPTRGVPAFWTMR